MRKYKGRKDKRAKDHMRKHKIKGWVIHTNINHYVAQVYDPDEKKLENCMGCIQLLKKRRDIFLLFFV